MPPALGIGTTLATESPADGDTLGMAISAPTINPSLVASLPYDTLKDLVGSSQMAQAHFGLSAHPSLPVNTMPELLAYAKANYTEEQKQARAPALWALVKPTRAPDARSCSSVSTPARSPPRKK